MNDTERMQEFADADHARQPVCSDCGCPGVPYEYHGIRHDGLIAYKGDRLCKTCSDVRYEVEGVNILVKDDRPGREPYVYNTVRDRDLVTIFIPPELRGHDGRDRLPQYPRRKRKA